MERRTTDFDIKDFDSDGTFYGYGAVFGNVDSHKDVIDQGAFDDTLAYSKSTNDWPMLLLQHGADPTMGDIPIGIWTDMTQDSKGLFCQGKLCLDNSRGRDVHALMKMQPRPALNGLSVGYIPRLLTVHPAGVKSDGRRRTLHKIHLIETSLVTRPSNPLARVSSVKSYDAGDKVLLALRRLADLS